MPVSILLPMFSLHTHAIWTLKWLEKLQSPFMVGVMVKFRIKSLFVKNYSLFGSLTLVNKGLAPATHKVQSES